jgi:hypothetical protein
MILKIRPRSHGITQGNRRASRREKGKITDYQTLNASARLDIRWKIHAWAFLSYPQKPLSFRTKGRVIHRFTQVFLSAYA